MWRDYLDGPPSGPASSPYASHGPSPSSYTQYSSPQPIPLQQPLYTASYAPLPVTRVETLSRPKFEDPPGRSDSRHHHFSSCHTGFDTSLRNVAAAAAVWVAHAESNSSVRCSSLTSRYLSEKCLQTCSAWLPRVMNSSPCMNVNR